MPPKILDTTSKPSSSCCLKSSRSFIPGLTDLTVVPRLLNDLSVYVPHPARPTVVTGFVVVLFAFGELLLDFIERHRRHSRRIESVIAVP